MLRGRTPATPGGGADRHPDRAVRATRAAAEPRQCLAALDDPHGVASLLDRLREAGAHEQAAAQTARLPATGMFGLFPEQKGAADQFRSGREADGTRPRHGAGKTWTHGLFPGCGHRRPRHGT